MKKYRQSPKIQKMIAARRNRSTAHYKEWKKAIRRSMLGISKDLRPQETERLKGLRKKNALEKVPAPVNFSLNNNPNEAVRFIAKIEKLYIQGNGVYVDLQKVEEIDYGAIVSLLAILKQFRRKKIKINGNFPENEKCEKILKDSGFLYSLYRDENTEELQCISNSADNSIDTYGWMKVDMKLSAKIIGEASKTVWGEARRCQGVQRCIGELMLNTNNHADLTVKGAKSWWLYVNHDKELRTVSFAFVDFGIGIFESLKNKDPSSKFFGWTEKFKDYLRSNKGLLSKIMSGEFHQTVTNKYYRGKGLPGIAATLSRNQISNLRIASNNVMANVSTDEYQELDASFSGTYVYWELNAENEYCDN